MTGPGQPATARGRWRWVERRLRESLPRRITHGAKFAKITAVTDRTGSVAYNRHRDRPGKSQWRMNIGTGAWGVDTQAGAVVAPNEVRQWLKSIRKLAPGTLSPLI